MVGGSGGQDGLLPVPAGVTSGSHNTGTESELGSRGGANCRREVGGSVVGRGFLMEREGPDAVTPIEAQDGEELGMMGNVGRCGGEAGAQPFWGGKVGKLGYEGGKMEGLATLPVLLCGVTTGDKAE